MWSALHNSKAGRTLKNEAVGNRMQNMDSLVYTDARFFVSTLNFIKHAFSV